jgi:hypothetical protein
MNGANHSSALTSKLDEIFDEVMRCERVQSSGGFIQDQQLWVSQQLNTDRNTDETERRIDMEEQHMKHTIIHTLASYQHTDVSHLLTSLEQILIR